MKKLDFDAKKVTSAIRLGAVPRVFERYEILIVVLGTFFAFLAAGSVFYEKAYRTVLTPPRPQVQAPSIDRALFEKTLKELEQKKQPPPSEPIVDPFR